MLNRSFFTSMFVSRRRTSTQPARREDRRSNSHSRFLSSMNFLLKHYRGDLRKQKAFDRMRGFTESG
jgi:hypothetical protein